MDRLRVVTFSPGGRPITVLDLNDSTTYSLVRDTLKINAPAKQQQWSQSAVRYQGSRLAREAHDNATIEAEWYVAPGPSVIPHTWTPNDVTGCELWLAADNITGLTDGQAVSTWTDASTLGNNASQAIGGNQPLYKTNITNGKPGVLFDGVDDSMGVAGLINNDPTRTVFMVTKVVGSGALAGMFRLGGNNAASIASTNSGNFLYAANQAGSNVTFGTQNSSPHIFTVRYNATNSADLYYDNGSATNFDPNDNYQNGSSGSTLGGNQGGFFSNFYMHELVVFNSALSDANRQLVRDYLGAKYNLGFGSTPGPVTPSSAPPADAALANLQALFRQLESLDDTRYLEWRPENATRSVYYPLRGPAPWEFMYRWIESQATKTFHVKGGWSIAPLAEGDRMEIFDPFDVNSVSDFTMDAGTAPTYTSTGLVLTPTIKHASHTARSIRYGDAQVTARYLVGQSLTPATDELGAVVSQIDASNYINVRVNNGNLTIQKVVAGTPSNAASVGLGTALAAGQNVWVVARREGNMIYAEHWISEPWAGGTPTTSTSWQLTGSDRTLFGRDTTGLAAWRALAATPGVGAGAWQLQSFAVEPYTYRNATLVDQFSLDGPIPGDAPAPVDITLGQNPSGGNFPIFALIAWTPRPLPFNYVYNGDNEISSYFTYGWSNAASGALNAGSTVTRDTTTFFSGSASRKIVTTAASTFQGQSFRVYGNFKANEIYTLDFYANTGAASTWQGFIMDSAGGNNTVGLAASSTWTRYTVSWQPVADRPWMDVGFRDTTAASVTGFFDNIQLYKGTVAPTLDQNRDGRGGLPPFGILEAEGGPGITATTDANARAGFSQQTTASGSGNITTAWLVDPATLTADDLANNEIDIELWIRATLPTTLVTPRADAFIAPLAGGQGLNSWRYTTEFGSAGRAVTPVGNRALYRIGTLSCPTDASALWTIQTRIYWAAGSSGTVTVDHVIMVPVRSRASTPTGKAGDTSYPKFFNTGGGVTKKVTSQLRGLARYSQPGVLGNTSTQWAPESGLGGALLQFKPGNNDVVIKLSAAVPDSPVAGQVDNNAESVTVKFSPIPRYFLPRGT
jgi:hypothetical protein